MEGVCCRNIEDVTFSIYRWRDTLYIIFTLYKYVKPDTHSLIKVLLMDVSRYIGDRFDNSIML